MIKYKHIFFDLDHTLWDYDTNAGESLHELFEKHRLDQLNLFNPSQLTSTFLAVNNELWDLFNAGKIQRHDLRVMRFPMIFERLGAVKDQVPTGFEEEYIQLTPTKEKTFDGTFQTLDYLSEKYSLHLITNGFDDIQYTKLRSAGLERYFEVIVTSETTPYRKPDKEIFDLAMERAGATLSESLMIGDNLASDIAGAINAGMDYVWFNPDHIKTDQSIQHEIQNLIDLKNIL